jgi:putative CocE/NonD family hydrolase
MRDGVLLFADLYRPAEHGRYPVLVQRTPYNKSALDVTGIDYWRAARAGYAVLVQDVRGRFASQGTFYPFLHEANDGYDTVEWAAVQPWSSEVVGMVGGSYLGAAQWLAAVQGPPHLKAIFPVMTPSDYQEGWVFQGGAFQLGFCLSWTVLALLLADSRSEPNSPQHLALEHTKQHLAEAFNHLPLESMPFLEHDGKPMAPFFADWLKHADDDVYWERWRIEAHHPRLQVPAFHVGGWYDTFLAGTLRNFIGLTKAGNAPQRLLIGPWAHTSVLAAQVGELDFAPEGEIDLDGVQLRWFNHWLKGEHNGVLEEPPIHLFVMGEGKWRQEHEWPLARAQEVRYHLHSAGGANTLGGDGWLSTEPARVEQVDSFTYDPSDPVPTKGGGLCCDPTLLPGGAFDQRSLESVRMDVLVYTTTPLDEPIEVTGPIWAQLWVSSSAPDTDFTAKLVDVHPDGTAYNLADGIIRARYRESRVRLAPLEPDRAYLLKVDLGATSNLFKRGHRIRLDVSSSNFPRFDRNLNTSTRFAEGAQAQTALQTVLHDETHSSYLAVSVVSRTEPRG